jgi:hypothetical protein
MKRRIFKRSFIVLIALNLMWGFLCLSYAEIPATISYQGSLKKNGAPVNGSLDINFSIYTVKSGGVPLWTEMHGDPAIPGDPGEVIVTNGRFNVELGSINPLSTLSFDEKYYLGITVAGDSEMTPREPFTSVGYALNASHANKADRADRPSQESCAEGQHLRKVNSDWVCTDRVGKADRADRPSQESCAEGQLLRKVNGDWICTDTVGRANAVTNGSITLGSLSPTLCSYGQILINNGYGWVCKDDRFLYANVAVVAKSGGDYTDPWVAMANLYSWCPVPVNGCLLKIMPGQYDLGTRYLTMVDGVDIEGSGENSTTLKSSATYPAIMGANAELRSLSVENISGYPSIVIPNGSLKITNVTTNYWIENWSPEALTISNSSNRGVRSLGGDLTLNNVTIRSYSAVGVYVSNNNYTDTIVKITDSDIDSTTTIALSAGSNNTGKLDVYVVNTVLKGVPSVPIYFGPLAKGNPFHCIGVYTTVPFTLLDSTCQ